MTKTATFSLQGNTYEVDAALVGRRVEVVFVPFDLTALEVRFQGRPMGMAVAHKISRHIRPGAHPDTAPAPAAATGIDYLALVADRHTQVLATRINYNDLPTTDRATGRASVDVDDALEVEFAGFAALARALPPGALPGQLDLTGLTGLDSFTPDDYDEDPR